MKKLLIVTRRDPFNELGGDTRRILQYINYFNKSANVTILCYGNKNADHKVNNIRIITVKYKRMEGLLSGFVSFLHGRPFQSGLFNQKIFTKILLSLLDNHFDIAIIHLIRFAYLIKVLSKINKLVIELTDSISLNYFRGLSKKGLLAPIYLIEAILLKKQEQAIINMGCIVVYVSPIDASHSLNNIKFQGVKRNVYILPNYITTNSKPSKQVLKKYDLVFVGRLSSVPNIEAFDFIIEDLLLELKKYNENIQVLIAGSDCPNFIESKCKKFKDNVTLRKNVKDLSLLIQEAKIGICPIKSAAGMQNKILDYIQNQIIVAASKETIKPFLAFDKRFAKNIIEIDMRNAKTSAIRIIGCLNSISSYDSKIYENKILIQSYFERYVVEEKMALIFN